MCVFIVFSWEMLTDVLRTMINNPFKKKFIGKEKKTITILTAFSISHKSGIKNFLK